MISKLKYASLPRTKESNSRGRQVLKRLLAMTIFAIALGGNGLLLNGVASAAPPAPTPSVEPQCPGGTYVSELFKFSPVGKGQKSELAVILAVDIDGIVKGYYKNGQSISTPFPFPAMPGANNIFDMVALGVILRNPTICWTTTSGDKQCVTY